MRFSVAALAAESGCVQRLALATSSPWLHHHHDAVITILVYVHVLVPLCPLRPLLVLLGSCPGYVITILADLRLLSGAPQLMQALAASSPSPSKTGVTISLA